MIPKIIHYIWLSDKPLNEVAQRCIESWKRIAEGFEIRRWKMSDFDFNNMPDWVKEAVSVKKWAFACDYLRLYVLEKEGGFYFDSDVLMLKPLDEFLDNGFVSSVEYYPELFDEGPEGYKKVDENGHSDAEMVEGMAIQAAVMGSVPGHPYVRKIMEYYETQHFINSDGSLNNIIIAPHIYAKAARDFGFIYKNQFQKLESDITLYESAVFAGGYDQCSSESVVIHLCTNTWVDFSKQEHRIIDCKKIRQINELEKVKYNKIKDSVINLKILLNRVDSKIRIRSKHGENILFLSLDYSDYNGGSVINRRNLDFLKEYFGDENVYEYRLKILAPGRFRYIRYLFFKINNVRLFTESDIEKIIKREGIKYVFCCASCLGLFSRRFIKKNNFITFFHNVEAIYNADETKGSSKLSARYMNIALRTVEKRNCLYSAMNICLNRRDSNDLKRLYGRGADLILPSSMQDTYRKYDESEIPDIGDYLLFVGSDFYGNTEGLFDFIENCLPYIDCKLLIVGNGMEHYRDKYYTDKAEFIGFVEDLGPYYAGAKAVVLPIISGSGMKTKTCEALMQGKIIFGTDEAFEGFAHINEADCVLCNTHEEFINRINEFIKNDKISDSDSNFSSKSRAVFEKYYSNEAVFKLFKEKMELLL